MTTDARVIVVGAGPAGCATAIRLLRRGIGPVLLVDRSRFPRVKACAGGISARSARCLADLGLLEEVERRAYRITGAVIENQSGKRMRFSGGGGALVMPRDRLDALLAEAAESEGARFVQGVHVDSVRRMQDGGLALEVKGGGALTCSRLVVATGASARLAGTPVPDRTLVTMTGWYRDLPFEPGTLEMFFSKELAPHYGWLFPEGPNAVNIGICVDRRNLGGRNVKDVFSRFLDGHFKHRLAHAKSVRRAMGHAITASDRVLEPRVPRGVLVVGEAARLANYFTGEGIYHALASGICAADTLADSYSKGWPWQETASRYRSRIRRRLGINLTSAGALARLGPPALELLARLYALPRTRPLLAGLLARL